jgi:hypothetical protein
LADPFSLDEAGLPALFILKAYQQRRVSNIAISRRCRCLNDPTLRQGINVGNLCRISIFAIRKRRAPS